MDNRPDHEKQHGREGLIVALHEDCLKALLEAKRELKHLHNREAELEQLLSERDGQIASLRSCILHMFPGGGL
jgi:hypothetical protein